mgnify:CR=1 FL=1
MDRETLNKRINAGNFVETNGSIMRTLIMKFGIVARLMSFNSFIIL